MLLRLIRVNAQPKCWPTLCLISPCFKEGLQLPNCMAVQAITLLSQLILLGLAKLMSGRIYRLVHCSNVVHSGVWWQRILTHTHTHTRSGSGVSMHLHDNIRTIAAGLLTLFLDLYRWSSNGDWNLKMAKEEEVPGVSKWNVSSVWHFGVIWKFHRKLQTSITASFSLYPYLSRLI